MPLSVKRKIQLGTSFLFLLLLLTGVAGIYFTTILKNEAKAILQDNYESVDYCHDMQRQMDSISYNRTLAIHAFDSSLRLQEHNITEPGEGDATRELRQDFDKVKKGDTSHSVVLSIHNEIQRILYLNMNAIYHKDDKAKQTAERADTIIISIVCIVFLLAFTFSFNFPTILTGPIKELSQALKEISNKNYRHRVRINNKDEFGVLADAFNVMAERLEYFENSNLNKLMFEKSRAEAVINSLKDASIGIDKDNNILFANYQALQLLGLKSTDVVGKTAEQLSKQNDLFAFLLKNESAAPFKIVVENRENYFVKETMEVAQGESNSKVIVLRNITSFKELDVAKTNFIATISHELKTPLAASDFSLKLLEDPRIGALSAEQKELIQNLKHDNQRVLKILSDLLDMSQVEAGRIELNVQSVNPYLIIDHAIETVTASAREKNIKIEKEVQDGLPLVQADAEKSTWVLNNFLTNAIKNSTDGKEIKVIAKKSNNMVQFLVEDHGPGIAKEYLPRLFERYFKVPGSKSKGTGLGLGISKEFIEVQKGTIGVESEIGQGSTFYFMLPAAKGEQKTVI